MALEHLPPFPDLDLDCYKFQYDGFNDTETDDELELIKIFRCRENKIKGFIALHLTKEELVKWHNWVGDVISRKRD